MTDYSSIVPHTLLLERTPADTSCAVRSYETAQLTIDDDGNVAIRTRTFYGSDGVPTDEWNRRTLVYNLASSEGGSCLLDSERLRDELADGGKLAALIDRIKAGHSVEWNGSNHVGRLDADAEEAAFEIQDADYAADVDVWDAYTWIMASGCASTTLAEVGLSVTASEEQIAAAALKLKADAEKDGTIIVGDMENAIHRVIDEADLSDDLAAIWKTPRESA